ncbi:DUF1987 domain-containing protein [Terasakiella sp. A23]|uniref:DUF1987 domain-containing protein n=1 Tax=Terasakiella sp. FCG-A23 TaxID=3080561 RepID=UPI002952C85B|nr:DUF1987 domain-containing protein [Terasakiella sp. A23]MDV7339619.1 DUF1987 domain-containing protein [Terasakiella sp. A23]
MENIKLASTERSPEVDFDFEKNVFFLRGESYPEDVNEFYGPVMEKLESHFEAQSGQDITFTFELIYFNSSTAKILMALFELFDETCEAGNQVSIKWAYEEDDDNMLELGEEYGEDLEHASFELVEVAV